MIGVSKRMDVDMAAAAKRARAALAILTFWSSPAIAGPPYITDDPEPVEYQRWEFYAFSQGGRANGETSGVAPSCDCNYGILPNVDLHIQPGAAVRRASGASLAWGPSDTEFGLKYRFVEQDKTNATPSIAFYPLLEVPTGDPTRGLGAGRTRAFLPVLGQKDFGDWLTFGGGGYWIQSLPRRQEPLVHRLGLATQAYTEQIGRSASQSLHDADADRDRWSSRAQRQEDNLQNVGAIDDLTLKNFHLLASAGKGLQHARRETDAFTWADRPANHRRR